MSLTLMSCKTKKTSLRQDKFNLLFHGNNELTLYTHRGHIKCTNCVEQCGVNVDSMWS